MSIGKTVDDGNVSVFTERNVKLYKEMYLCLDNEQRKTSSGGQKR